jgi:hypothetical protein
LRANLTHLSLTALLTLLAACGGGSDGGAYCASINGGGSQTSSSCTGCTIENEAAAADDDLYSSANAMAIAASVSITLRATAPEGVVYPAGSEAGVFFSSNTDSCSNCAVTVSTYLDGVLQNSSSGVTNTFVEGRGSPADQYTSVNTLHAFDAVEISASGSVAGVGTGESAVLETYEICSDGGVR